MPIRVPPSRNPSSRRIPAPKPSGPALIKGFEQVNAMPFKRVGATKITDHHIRSPLLNLNHARQGQLALRDPK